MNTNREPALTASDAEVARALHAANDLYRAGNVLAARDAYAALVRASPAHPLALSQLGALQLITGERDAAVNTLRQLRRSSADAIPMLNALGAAFLRQGDAAHAVVALREAIAARQSDAKSHYLLGQALRKLGAHDEAIAALQRAVELDPAPAQSVSDLCDMLIEHQNLDAARAVLQSVLARQPDNMAALYKSGFVEMLARNLDAASALFTQVSLALPDYAPTYLNLGTIATWRQDAAGAERLFRHALSLQPDFADAKENLALAMLAQGRYQEGWQQLEAHAADASMQQERPFPAVPPWDGRADPATILLVYPEQGLGDTIQFARYLRMARMRIGRLLLYIDGYWRPLQRLLAPVDGVDAVIDASSSKVKVSHTCSIMSLPHLLGLGAPDPDAAAPYLSAPTEDVLQWKARLAGEERLKAGLVWAGNPRVGQRNAAMMDRRRSIGADTVKSLLELSGVCFFSLQLGGSIDSEHVIDYTNELRDMAATAALVTQLDVVISVDTSVVHLVGGLGKPIWMLNRFDSCWRWQSGSTRTPWYPTMRIFWQRSLGDWGPVIGEVKAALAALRDQARTTRGEGSYDTARRL